MITVAIVVFVADILSRYLSLISKHLFENAVVEVTIFSLGMIVLLALW